MHHFSWRIKILPILPPKPQFPSPTDEDIKDTNSKLMQPTHSHELDVNKLCESHDDNDNEEDSLVLVGKKVQIQKICDSTILSCLVSHHFLAVLAVASPLV
jgi:hypothetical protein